MSSVIRAVPVEAEPLEQASMRMHNMSIVLRHLRDHGPLSRSRLADLTTMTKSGVSNIVEELISRSLLVESERQQSPGRGRPSTLLAIDGSAAASIALELNAFHSSALVTDLRGEQLNLERVPARASGTMTERLAEIKPMVDRAMSIAADSCRVIGGIAVTIPAPITVDGRVSSIALGWSDVDVAAALRMIVPSEVPIELLSVGRYAALAEYRHLLHTGFAPHSLLHFELGVSIGASLVVAGELALGANSIFGSIAHIKIDPQGKQCRCGRVGCLETTASFRSLLEHTAPDLLPRWGDDPQILLDEIAMRATSADPEVLQGLESMTDDIAKALSIAVTILDPEVVMLGGYPTVLGPWLLDSLRQKIRPMMVDSPRFSITVSPLGTNAALIGATQVVRDRIFDAPELATAR